MLYLKFSIYLSGSTLSLSFCSYLLYLLGKCKITTIKSTNAVMQPIALPTIIIFLVHFSLISVLSSIWVLVGVESKLNRFSLYFQENKNKLIWIQIKILSSYLNYKHYPVWNTLIHAANEIETKATFDQELI